MRTMKNKVQLIGNLGMNPEVKELSNGKKVARFALATHESYKDKSGEYINDTHWHNVVVWGKLADSVEKTLIKGTEVALEGKLQQRSYDDKDGNKRYVTEVLLNDFVVLKGKKTEKV